MACHATLTLFHEHRGDLLLDLGDLVVERRADLGGDDCDSFFKLKPLATPINNVFTAICGLDSSNQVVKHSKLADLTALLGLLFPVGSLVRIQAQTRVREPGGQRDAKGVRVRASLDYVEVVCVGVGAEPLLNNLILLDYLVLGLLHFIDIEHYLLAPKQSQ